MMRWTHYSEGAPQRVNHAACRIRDCIYSFGGYCTGDDYETFRPIDVFRLYTVTLKWYPLPLPTEAHDIATTPYQRYGHTVVEFNNNAFLWGGRNDGLGASDILHRFDGDNCSWDVPYVTGTIPDARDGHSACMIKSRMYIFGGYEDRTQLFSNDMNYVDLITFTWVQVATKGSPAQWRDFHTATAVGNTMLIFGGRCDEGGDHFTNNEVYDNMVMAFDTTSATWSCPVQPSPTSPVGRRSHSAFLYENSLYIFGGFNGKKVQHFNDLHRLNLSSMEWSPVRCPGRPPVPRRRSAVVMVGSRCFIFGGTSPKVNYEPKDTNDPYTDLNLVDRSDLHVLDLNPSLKTIAAQAVLKHQLDTTFLSLDIREEMSTMVSDSCSYQRQIQTTNG